MGDQVIFLSLLIGALLILLAATSFGMLKESSKEGYRDPIYLNKEKMDCMWYPYSNGSIYGPDSNIFTGYQYNFKAY